MFVMGAFQSYKHQTRIENFWERFGVLTVEDMTVDQDLNIEGIGLATFR